MFEANVHCAAPGAREAARAPEVTGPATARTCSSHSIEVSRLAAMMADELGASAKTARRAALLHDIGKAVSHEVEGPHALVGGELARRYREPEAVAHAMEAHHNEVEMQTVEAVIVQAADSLSGARPGRPRRVARALRQAPARTSRRSPRATRASRRSTRCRPAARSA